MLKLCLFIVVVSLTSDIVAGKLSKIIGGTTATQAQYPFMVSIQNYTENIVGWIKTPNYQHLCSGAILNPSQFVTSGKL
jgi:secreted trypsin-like serine protease